MVNINIPEDVLSALGKNEMEIAQELLVIGAERFYENNKLPLRKCAILANMSEERFLLRVNKDGLPIFKYEDDCEFYDYEHKI